MDLDRKPVIGVTPLYDAARGRVWMLPDYLRFLETAGALPVILPEAADDAALRRLVSLCDGFLFTGGQDVSPALYGEENRASGELCPRRDALERKLLALALAADKPVLAICRGLQLLNAALGGTLWQDLPSERPSPVAHHMERPYDADAHRVTLLPDTPLAERFGAGERGVNSLHHQALRALAPALRPMALSEDGLTEAAWLPGKRFVWGVQWHPEYRPADELSRALARALTEAAWARD